MSKYGAHTNPVYGILLFGLAIGLTTLMCASPLNAQISPNDVDQGIATTGNAANVGELGAELRSLSTEGIKTLQLTQDHALLVVLPYPGGPAEQGGLKTGDIILELAGSPVPDKAAFLSFIEKRSPSEEITLRIMREATSLIVLAHAGSASDQKEALEKLGGTRLKELRLSANNSLLSLLPRERFPVDWARTQNNLGNALGARIEGDRTENLEQSIRAFEAALTVFTRESFQQDWARIQNNLGLTYFQRVKGDRTENLENAIKAYKAALTVRTRETSPEDWASTQNSLGRSYASLPVEDKRAENLEQAIKAYQLALMVRTKDVNPVEWARTQNNLGLAYQLRIEGDHAENIEQAIKLYLQTLTVVPPDSFEWAVTQDHIGLAYQNRIRGNRSENYDEAIKAYELALKVATRSSEPRAHLEISRRLAGILMQRHEWPQASSVLTGSREAFFTLFGDGFDEEKAREVISKAGSISADAAYVEAVMGDAKSALSIFSEGRARLLASKLRTYRFTPTEKTEFDTLRFEIRRWDGLANDKNDGVANDKSISDMDRSAAIARRSEARSKVRVLLKTVSARNEIKPSIDEIAKQGLLKEGALIAPIVTEVGSKILIVTAKNGIPDISVVDYPDLTASKLKALLRDTNKNGQTTGWFKDYNLQPLLPKIWLRAIEQIGPKLWSIFAGRLDAGLKQAGVADGARLIFLPEGALGLLPLDLAREEATGRSFADAYQIVNIPSLEAYLAAAETLAKTATPSLAETIDPTGDIPNMALPFAEVEGLIIASHFKDSSTLDRRNASAKVVLSGLVGKSYWHFATHGSFDRTDARQSGLLMKNGEKLTIGELLDTREILGPRLVVLSACETGLSDQEKNPDEFVGLPSAFLELGAAGVIGSLWEVDDLATMLLMAKFYALHLADKLPAAAALKEAKAWLKNAKTSELIAFGNAQAKEAKINPGLFNTMKQAISSRSRAGSTRSATIWNTLREKTTVSGSGLRSWLRERFDPNSRPFAHPYYWSGFIYTGS